MNEYKISIIIPIFNAGKYLKTTLDSILNQTIGINNLEIHMINDSSTDNSKVIIDEYAEKYENFIAIHLKENTGSPSIPRNIGIKKASANYIMFLDQDDTYEKTFCEVLYNKITQTNANIVKCNTTIRYDDERKEPHYYFNENIKENIKEIEFTSQDKPLEYVSIWNGIHEKSFLIKNNIEFPDSLGEDIVFSLKEWIFLEKMIYLNNYFGYNHFFHDETSLGRTYSKKNFYETLKAFEISLELAKKHNREDLLPTIFNTQFYGIYIRATNNPSLNKREFLKTIYNFEKKLNFKLNLKRSMFYNFVNKLVMKKLFILANIILLTYPMIIQSKLIAHIYRKIS